MSLSPSLLIVFGVLLCLIVLVVMLLPKSGELSSSFVPCSCCEKADHPTNLYYYEERGGRFRYTVPLCEHCARQKKAVLVRTLE
ncbi:MAG TPA: hypothetical protein VKV40_08060 [Ktedonobacteraceae bacterium]|nr:hypothetical protein [Ktedonobacteraceae bacterium]